MGSGSNAASVLHSLTRNPPLRERLRGIESSALAIDGICFYMCVQPLRSPMILVSERRETEHAGKRVCADSASFERALSGLHILFSATAFNWPLLGLSSKAE